MKIFLVLLFCFTAAAFAQPEMTCGNRGKLCLKSLKSFLDTVSTGSDSDLVSDQHAILPRDFDSSSLTRSLSLPVLTVSKPDVRLLRQSHPGTVQGTILADVPQPADPNRHYLFYLSGYIVEAGNTRPISPKFGAYEYAQILQTFKDSGFVVISEAREKNPEIEPYARKLTGQITQMLKDGVPAKNITVVGASQGSWIAMLASTYLKNRDVNFVFIAACSADPEFLKLVDLHGNVLSIYERSDVAQSCRDYRTDATGISDWKEVEVNTGLKHGFLFRPMKEWVDPTVAWANSKH